MLLLVCFDRIHERDGHTHAEKQTDTRTQTCRETNRHTDTHMQRNKQTHGHTRAEKQTDTAWRLTSFDDMGRACRNCARGIALSEAMKPYCQTRGIARPLCDSRTTRYTTVPVFRSRKSNGNGSYLQKLLLRGENSVINFIVHTVMCQRCVILNRKLYDSQN